MLSASVQHEIVTGDAEFRVVVHPNRSQVIVAPSGELDLATVAHVDRELSELAQAGFTDIVLDLEAITFVDSTGLHLLLRQHGAARAAGRRFRITGGSDATRRLLELTGTSDTFEYVELR